MPSIFPLIHVDCTQCPDKVGLVPPKLQILWNKTYKTWFHEFGVISHRDGYLHLDSLETKMKFNRSKVTFLSWNKAPSAWFGDLLGLRGQKHSEALGSTAQFRYPQVVPCNGRGETEGCHRDFGPFLFTPAWKTIAAGENACIRSEKHHCIRSRFVLRDNLSISQVACPGSRSSPCFPATLGDFRLRCLGYAMAILGWSRHSRDGAPSIEVQRSSAASPSVGATSSRGHGDHGVWTTTAEYTHLKSVKFKIRTHFCLFDTEAPGISLESAFARLARSSPYDVRV